MRIIQRDIVGAFIFSNDGRLLLGKSHKGGVYKNHWIVPGGGIDVGETRIDALHREILEETGIDAIEAEVKEIKGVLTGESEKILRDTQERVIVQMKFHNFEVLLSKPSVRIRLKTDDDFKEAQWFPASELKKLKLSPPSITTLQKLGYL